MYLSTYVWTSALFTSTLSSRATVCQESPGGNGLFLSGFGARPHHRRHSLRSKLL